MIKVFIKKPPQFDIDEWVQDTRKAFRPSIVDARSTPSFVFTIINLHAHENEGVPVSGFMEARN
ncbi:hypothetical protein JCM31598_31010 [Desulfonatronum parangueonense]